MFSLRCCALFAVLSLLAAPAIAGNPHKATVRIVSASGSTTGTVIHQSAEHGTFILTCRHGYNGSESFHFETGSRSLAGENRIASTDGDLALMWRRGTGLTAETCEIASLDVAEGEKCLSIGHDKALADGKFSPNGSSTPSSWTSEARRLTKINRAAGEGTGRRVSMSIETATIRRGGPGRSGGGLFNAQGGLVGVCSQDRFEGCVFVSHSAIVRFLNRCASKGLIAWWTPRDAFDDRARQDLTEYHVGWAKNFCLEGRYEESIESYNAALALVPESNEARYGLAVAFQKSGAEHKALEHFRLVSGKNYGKAAQSQIALLAAGN